MTMVVTLNADGTITLSFSITGSPCDVRATVSGLTATATSAQTCGDGGIGDTLNSYTFTVNGDGATFSASAVLHGLNQQPDGSFAPIDLGYSLSGTCTRGGPDSGVHDSGGDEIPNCNLGDGDPCSVCDKAQCCCLAAVGQSFCSAYSGAGCRAASPSNQSYLIMQCGIEVGATTATNACR
jgi:hypothetical protein